MRAPVATSGSERFRKLCAGCRLCSSLSSCSASLWIHSVLRSSGMIASLPASPAPSRVGPVTMPPRAYQFTYRCGSAVMPR